MANFTIPYTTPANYTFDSDKILVDSGLAKLIDLVPSDATFFATYTNNINGNFGGGVLTGTGFGSPVITGNKLDLTGGVLKYVDYAGLNNISNILQTGAIRFKFTPNYNGIPASHQYLITICNAPFSQKNRIFLYHNQVNGFLSLGFYDKNGNNKLAVSTSVWNPTSGQEYEFEFNFNLSTTFPADTIAYLYIDGTQFGATYTNFICERDSNAGLLRVGADPNATFNSDYFIADFITFDATQHASNYTPGYSLPETQYADDSPTIYKTLGDSIANIEIWMNFLETLGGGNEGSIQYQLSEDAITWYYWDGGAWSVAGVSDYNTVTIVNTNIGDFPTIADKIFAKAFLISDGDQKVELDLNEIGYIINTVPNVYAGTNKNVIYNISTTPFSDSVFSDAEGNIVKAEWKEDGGIYVEIPQGVYSTLLEAVQAFEYTPTHSGNKTLYLKITDSFDAFTEDDLIINVNQVTVIVNIKNSNSFNLLDVIFTPGDGGAASSQNSPFSYTYNIGTWTATCTKTGFLDLSQSVTISIAVSEVNFVMVEKTPLSDLTISIDWPVNFHLGDSVNIPCTVDGDLTGYKIRCEFFDNCNNEIKLGNVATGGSESEIADTVPSEGKFLIQVAEDLTTDFDKKSFIELELEDTDGDKYTIYRAEFRFKKEEITWTDPTD